MGDHPPRVLIVDDEPEQVRALSYTLSTDGLLTTGAGNAAEALAILRSAMESPEQTYDILITDLQLPNMDGIALLRQAQLIDPDLVAVLMTGHGSIPTAVEAMTSGALDYLQKPFGVAAIRSVVSRALAVRRLRVQNASLLQHLQERTWELEVSNRDLQSANRELNALAHALSAQLRDPLSTILDTLTHVLGEQPRQPDSDVTGSLTDVMDRCRRMIDSLDALWHLSELSARPATREWLDVRALVDDILRELSAKGAGDLFDISVTGLPEATADPRLLRMVFTVLLSSSIEHLRTAMAPKLKITGERHGHAVIFLIRASDAGSGPVEASSRIERFRTIPVADGFGTSATGLSTARRIIERLGGRLTTEATSGREILFSIRLPG